MIKILALFLTFSFVQSSSDTIKSIETAMKAGSAKELVKFFNETVELKIDGTSSNYSRNQAEMVLRKFFQKNAARGFSYIHQGASEGGLKYTIGKYQFDGGSYRVVMFLKKSDNKYLVDTLNFTLE
ncbi:MAG: DUF4783 domain-containing protein [Cyclobacteriaceae bacterium]